MPIKCAFRTLSEEFSDQERHVREKQLLSENNLTDMQEEFKRYKAKFKKRFR
ncbi:hypothetical protein [Jeotgalibacillus terrae]|uniref:FbpB family small basic protein n=1 Tax=Jeotgalibacillus terrae TaxID=587735 RepID=A0ABW5ZLT4_9BACL|nr:hypothetical protein [Jeotgalibacillus terrae]MBM7581091.1 hypothetical protein [Jeotgalibacillus terrae]